MIQTISTRVIPEEYRRVDTSATSARITSKVETTFKGIRIYEIKMEVIDSSGRIYQQIARLSRDSLFIGALDWDFFSPEQHLVDYKHNVDVYLPQ